MTGGEQAARAIFGYDRRVAERVLQLIPRELGIEEKEPSRLQACLLTLHENDGADKTTREWKVDFGQSERLRSLALALAELVVEPERRDP